MIENLTIKQLSFRKNVFTGLYALSNSYLIFATGEIFYIKMGYIVSNTFLCYSAMYMARQCIVETRQEMK